jgi:ABC-2 type transport system ATP-binding protein
MIKIFNVNKRFKNVVALNDLSLQVNKGDIFGYIGPNGAGKTTTIRILATLLPPDDGYAEIAGYNILTRQRDVRRTIGYMPDFFGVYDDMYVWEYLDFFASAYRVERSKRKRIVNDVLELTDLGSKRDDSVDALSRGMKQRLCLAKTLLHDPAVLLLDEPASGLDPRARIEMREIFKELNRMGKTILISSHILTELSEFCNAIGIIEKGVLLCSGDVDTIVAQLRGARRLEIRVKANPEKARDILLQQTSVVSVDADGNDIEVETSADLEDTSGILTALVHNGIQIVTFKEVETDLEDVFMKITKGAVQ